MVCASSDPGVFGGEIPVAVKLHGEVESESSFAAFYGGVGELEAVE